jgi:hypothetical protein
VSQKHHCATGINTLLIEFKSHLDGINFSARIEGIIRDILFTNAGEERIIGGTETPLRLLIILCTEGSCTFSERRSHASGAISWRLIFGPNDIQEERPETHVWFWIPRAFFEAAWEWGTARGRSLFADVTN